MIKSVNQVYDEFLGIQIEREESDLIPDKKFILAMHLHTT